MVRDDTDERVSRPVARPRLTVSDAEGLASQALAEQSRRWQRYVAAVEKLAGGA